MGQIYAYPITAYYANHATIGCLMLQCGRIIVMSPKSLNLLHVMFNYNWGNINWTNLVFGLYTLTSGRATDNGFSLPRYGVHVSGRDRLSFSSNIGRLAATTAAKHTHKITQHLSLKIKYAIHLRPQGWHCPSAGLSDKPFKSVTHIKLQHQIYG